MLRWSPLVLAFALTYCDHHHNVTNVVRERDTKSQRKGLHQRTFYAFVHNECFITLFDITILLFIMRFYCIFAFVK